MNYKCITNEPSRGLRTARPSQSITTLTRRRAARKWKTCKRQIPRSDESGTQNTQVCTQKEEWAVGRSLCRMFMRLCKVKNSSNSSVCVCCSAHQCYRQTDAMWSLQRFRPKSSISATTSIGIAGMGEMNFCNLRAFNYIWQLKLNLSQSAEIWNTYL